VVNTWWGRSGIVRGQKGWVGMVRLRGARREDLCTKWVILNEDGGRRK